MEINEDKHQAIYVYDILKDKHIYIETRKHIKMFLIV